VKIGTQRLLTQVNKGTPKITPFYHCNLIMQIFALQSLGPYRAHPACRMQAGPPRLLGL